MIRFLRFAVPVMLLVGIVAIPLLKSSAVNTGMVSVIVELRGDPAAIYAAKAKQRGAPISDDQLRTYRNSLTVTQNQFLTALKTTVPTAQVESVNVKDSTGAIAGNVQFRSTVVYNGLSLACP